MSQQVGGGAAERGRGRGGAGGSSCSGRRVEAGDREDEQAGLPGKGMKPFNTGGIVG